MKTKSFTARSLGVAIRAIKESMGADAVLVATRKLPDGQVQVTAGFGAAGESRRSTEPQAVFPRRGRPQLPRLNLSALDEARNNLAVAPEGHGGRSQSSVIPAVSLPARPDDASRGPSQAPRAARVESLRKELAELRQGRAVGPGTRPEPPRDLFEALHDRMIESGMATEDAAAILKRVRSHSQAVGNEQLARRAMRQEISARVRASEGFERAFKERVVAFVVGPTGVGKTTTVAKIAAQETLERDRSVGLITIDAYRIGAVDQLQTYAEILGLPFRACSEPSELVDALDDMAALDLVLVDTAGHNPFSDEIGGFLPYLQLVPGAEVHLALAAPTRDLELERIIERHSMLRFSHLIFTKLDEALEFGALVSLQRRAACPVSFLTTGQRVPEDLEAARSSRLAAAVLEPTVFAPFLDGIAEVA